MKEKVRKVMSYRKKYMYTYIFFTIVAIIFNYGILKSEIKIGISEITNFIFFWGIVIFSSIVVFKRFYKDKNIIEEINNFEEFSKEINIQNIDSKYYELDDELAKKEKYKNISEIWTVFSDTIISKEDINKTERIYQTVDAEFYFNSDSLLKEKMNYKWYNYIPHMLVGIGLLGTFLGLSIALSHIDLNSVDKSKMTDFMNGIKTKFYTSLYGMYYSIILSVIFSMHFGEYEEKITRIKDKLNKIFHKNINDKMIDEIKKEIINLRASNDDMATRLANQLGEGMLGISQGINGTFEKSMGDSLEKVFSSDFIKRFEDIKNELIDVSEKNNKFISEYKDEIKEIAYKTGELKDSYIETSNTIIDDFETLFKRIDSKFIQIEEVSEKSLEMYKDLNSLYSKNKEYIESMQEFLGKSEKISTSLDKFVEAENSVIKLWEEYKINFDGIDKSINQNMKNYEETLRITVNEYNNLIKESANSFGQVVQTGVNEYNKNINSGVKYLFEDYDKNLSEVVSKFNSVLQSFKIEIVETRKILNENINNVKAVIELKNKN